MQRRIDQFALSVAGGHGYLVTVLQEMIPAGTNANPNAVVPGQKTILTEEGYAVNYMGNGRYIVLEPLRGQVEAQGPALE